LDLETVLETADIMEHWFAEPVAFRTEKLLAGVGYDRTLTRDDLAALAPSDRRRLVMATGRHTDVPPTSATVSFNGSATGVTVVYGDTTIVFEEITNHLLANGRPRVEWARLRRYPVALVLPAVAACWLWTELSAPMPLPAHILGWILFAILFAVSLRPFARYFAKPFRPPGHLIRMESRAQTFARRADGRRDLKVGLVTTAIAAPLSVIGTLLATWLTG
jgi:hypothetical protein